jgi:hypothetical protein
MVKAGMKDPELEEKCLKVLQETAKDREWKEEFLEVKISSNDWNIQRDKGTGVILGRSLLVNAKVQGQDGRCSSNAYVLKSNYDGIKYSDRLSVFGYGAIESEYIDCDAISEVSSEGSEPETEADKPKNSFSVMLTGNLKTHAEINKGDDVTINARGYVEINKKSYVVYASPNGTDTQPQIFDLFGLIVKSAREGCLLARVNGQENEKWIVIGSQKTFIAPNAGKLELQVNNKKYQDNKKGFDVHVYIERVN